MNQIADNSGDEGARGKFSLNSKLPTYLGDCAAFEGAHLSCLASEKLYFFIIECCSI